MLKANSAAPRRVRWTIHGEHLYHSTKEHLDRRNVELQQKLERGTALLEMQEAELQRALEIQQSLLPRNGKRRLL